MKKIIVICIVSIICGLNSFAEEVADTSKVIDLDEVVVVATPKEQVRLRLQPVSSSVFGNEQLQQLNVRDLSQLSQYVPSFVMPAYGSRLTSSMYVRGIGSRINNPAVGDVHRMNTDRIGIDHEGSLRGAQADNTILLLQPAEQQSDGNTQDCSDGTDHSSFEKEDTCNLTVGSAQITECHYIVTFVDDEHRQRSDDVKTGYHQDKSQKNIGNEFFYFHDAERVLLLFIAVAHQELVAR